MFCNSINEHSSSTEAYTFVTVSGCIASGKSTTMKFLKTAMKNREILRYVFLEDDSLDLLRKDKKKCCFTLYTLMLENFTKSLNIAIEQAKHCRKINPRVHTIVVSERSPLDYFYVFCTYFLEEGSMSQEQYTLMESLYKDSIKPHWILYTTVSSTLSWERMNERNDPCEEECQRNYLDWIHTRYEKVMKNINHSHTKKVVILLANDKDVLTLQRRILGAMRVIETQSF